MGEEVGQRGEDRESGLRGEKEGGSRGSLGVGEFKGSLGGSGGSPWLGSFFVAVAAVAAHRLSQSFKC